ncbi:bacteriocin immunity protein [Citrobacter amalonaticus]|uniref:Bacteriocin immunity protein n=1 Tax=Citrobacter amalonaticus TaxID=35703 RepID=A0A2S4RSI5_CITAM|nr:bacteriocin immunity protein [Citrobacter amalonaticus]POT54949.1 bacteriocin immunity protein [Citrobacter amalonaticus]POT71256.1 bacteriocin immunity protein [Citrobacter amalonaticus]POU62660.1 bacteriocin immunity protein [Citrobacter amalonaticus]POV02978.1 bacteriocin immunity protein [Citrobacter amalonaticus]
MVTHKEITDFTEAEFLSFVEDICNDTYPSEKAHMAAVAEFERLSEHPSGSDLIYYPEEGKGGPIAVVQEIKEWRKANDKPGFRSE